MSNIVEKMLDVPAEHQSNVFGQFDSHIKKIEQTLKVSVIARDGEVKVLGPSEYTRQAARVIEQLLELSRRGNVIQEQNVDYALALSMEGQEQAVVEIDKELICHTIAGKPIKPKTLGQKKYVDLIRNHMIVFGTGPAGTGKTYLAVAMAVHMLNARRVRRIILTRPAVEAGEKLGFLPGDLAEKVNPYLRPLHDALLDMLGPQKMASLQETGIIEVAPLAFMRGRTLNDAFIILDEAQNTTREQMKMFLTRLGFGSRAAITGDITQIDLPAQGEDSASRSGLVHALQVLKGVKGVAFRHFTSADVVRHPLVGRIVQAYDDYEKLPSSHQ